MPNPNQSQKKSGWIIPLVIGVASLVVIITVSGFLFGWWKPTNPSPGQSKEELNQQVVYLKQQISDLQHKGTDTPTPTPATATARPSWLPSYVRQEPDGSLTIRIDVPPCSNTGDKNTWSLPFKTAGLAELDGKRGYTGDYINVSEFANIAGQGNKVYYTWYAVDPTVPLRAVMDDDFKHPLDPLPSRLDNEDSARQGLLAKVDNTITVKSYSTLRVGSKSNKGTTLVLTFHKIKK